MPPAASHQAKPASAPPAVPDAAPLDPAAPLAPLPDLGVAWPDLGAGSNGAPAEPVDAASGTELIGEARYAWAIEGLDDAGTPPTTG